MATLGARSVVVANGYDLTQFLRKVSVSMAADTAEATTFGSASKRRIAGLRDAQLTAEGLFSFDPAGLSDIDNALGAALGAPEVLWLYLPDGDTPGRRAVALAAVESSYEVSSDVEGVVEVKAEAAASGSSLASEAAVSLFSRGAPVTATTTGQTVDGGAASTGGVAGHLHVVDATGSPASVTVRIQHSADAATWADLVVFPAASGRTALRVQAGGTVQRYLRAVVTLDGTTTNATLAVCAARL